MTDEEIRIKVAEACGWYRKPGYAGHWERQNPYRWYVGDFQLPNYPEDLNACAEFEKTLTYEEAEVYEDELCDICKRDNDLEDNPAPWRFAVVTAKPKQRCLAYLKTKGLIP